MPYDLKVMWFYSIWVYSKKRVVILSLVSTGKLYVISLYTLMCDIALL